jgi:hypothetical protein
MADHPSAPPWHPPMAPVALRDPGELAVGPPPAQESTPVTQALSPVMALPEAIRAVVTPVGLDLDRFDELVPDLDLDQAGAILEGLSLLERATNWARGDFINYLDERFGEAASQYLSASDYEDSSLAVYAWCARAYRLEDRHPALTPSHHRVVAAAPEADRSKWLELAAADNWTVAQLRQAYLERQGKDEKDSRPFRREAALYSRQRIGELWTDDDHEALCAFLSVAIPD